MTTLEKIETLAILMELHTRGKLITGGMLPDMASYSSKVQVHYGKKYVRIDIGGSGKLMIDTLGNIYGIKGYGVIHKGHQYGTLDTIQDWYWGEYYPLKRIVK